MKNLALLFIAMLTVGSSYAAEENSTTYRSSVYDGSKYIFVEDGIEFSIFPDGEFDFYIPELVEGVNVSVNAGPVGISFNTGFDYDPYVQYDDYGAVIQIENTPLYYDNYGRISQVGDVNVSYRNSRINRVGGLQVYYNNYGVFSHYSGYINTYNRRYVYHPFHSYYYRPVLNRCLVYTTPYRRNFRPTRYNYSYHRNNYTRGYNRGYNNARRSFRRPNNGRVAHNNGRRSNVNRNNVRFNNIRNNSNASRAIATNSRNRSNRIANNTNGRNRLNLEVIVQTIRLILEDKLRVQQQLVTLTIDLQELLQVTTHHVHHLQEHRNDLLKREKLQQVEIIITVTVLQIHNVVLQEIIMLHVALAQEATLTAHLESHQDLVTLVEDRH